ncbi:MAG: hypothetical protein M0Z59_01460 [Nitrospiraceae bacterium]|nr:hypothetical protein [Nitrospiraceae bacterium]
MKKTALLLAALVVSVAASGKTASATDIGISLHNGNITGFYYSVGNYYRVPDREVVVVRRGIPDDELPVVFFLARRAHVAPEVIIRLRQDGYSWWDITRRYRIDPRVYYVPVRMERIGPPYGRAYGYFRHRHWDRRWRLDDREIVDLVNLRFASDYYHIPPERIIERRCRGERFAAIHHDYDRDRGDRWGHGRGDGEDHGHGRDYGRGHGRWRGDD